MSRTLKTRPAVGARYVVYYRVSDDKQGKSGLGLEAQRAMAETYLASVQGVVIAEYTEVETGKRHGKRPELAAAIAEVTRSKAILLIAKLDRLARNVAFVANLMESAADFVIADMPHANRLTIHILAAVAEYEGEMISERTRAALKAAKARGVKIGNPNWPAALALANEAKRRKRYTPAEAVAHLRESIERLRGQGLSFREIARVLNAAGSQTPTHAAWHPSSVRAILQLPGSGPTHNLVGDDLTA